MSALTSRRYLMESQQAVHGHLAVRTGASGPTSITGNRDRVFDDSGRGALPLWGCQHNPILLDGNIERIAARMPSRRRSGPGRTTWPFVDTLVCIVRQSYRKMDFSRTYRLLRVPCTWVSSTWSYRVKAGQHVPRISMSACFCRELGSTSAQSRYGEPPGHRSGT